MKLRLPLVAIVAAVLALAGCAAPPPAPSAAPTSATVTPTPTATPEAETRVVVATTTVDIYLGTELTSSWPHADRDPAEITALAAAFGSDPTVTTGEKPGEGAPLTLQYFTWPGFEVSMIISEFGQRHVFIEATAPSVGDARIETPTGVTIGDDAQVLAAANPDFSRTYDSPTGRYLLIGVDAIPTGFDGDYGPAADFVAVIADDPFTTVTAIRAPSANYGL